jgi:hypothetical protein
MTAHALQVETRGDLAARMALVPMVQVRCAGLASAHDVPRRREGWTRARGG